MSPTKICVILAISAFACFGQETRKLVPAEQLSDEISYTALFYVVRSAPAPHWDLATRTNWLKARGFDENEASYIIAAGTSFSQKHAEIEKELRQVHLKHAGLLMSTDAQNEQRAVQQKTAGALSAVLSELGTRIGPNGLTKLASHVANMKKDIKKLDHRH